jgi:acyl carrier protein
MNQQEILSKLQDVFSDVFDDDLVITPDTNSKTVDTWDSVTQVILMSAIEKKFAVTFSGNEIVDLQSAAKIIDTLEKKLA